MKTGKRKTLDVGRYYAIASYDNGNLSSDIREEFVYVGSEGVYDTRFVTHWIKVNDYSGREINTVDSYEQWYECKLEEVSFKKLLLCGLEKCYADRN